MPVLPRASLPNVFWPTLIIIVVRLCKYWREHKLDMPSDFPSQAITVLDGLEVACDILIEWDKNRKRGNNIDVQNDSSF